jgi:hypothetical protein
MTSRVRIPHIEGMIHPETLAWAQDYGAELVAHEDQDGHGYYELLRKWWRDPGDLVIVEQDKVPAEGVVDEMLACSFDWCNCPFKLDNGILHGWGTGCVKFSAALRERLPDLMDQAGVPGAHDPEPAGVYWVVDMRLGCLLAKNRVLPHGHAEVRHVHRHTKRELAWLREP